ncbi:MAG: DUF924 domain-containing protein [Moraxellaceae bacterium]|nr:MAG: DUF924 domain-containing protein [Moraxellaceae bacterium]
MFNDILKFWFEDIDQSKWWVKDTEFDNTVIEKFSKLHAAAKQGELYEWRVSARGRLAEIIVLDQFSRNMFRDSSLAFACDPMALVLAQEATAVNAHRELNSTECVFLFLPFMHSESLKIHERAMELYKRNGLQESIDFELKHKIIIERFGRYPHRNKALGRLSTATEIEFLKQPGSSF